MLNVPSGCWTFLIFAVSCCFIWPHLCWWTSPSCVNMSPIVTPWVVSCGGLWEDIITPNQPRFIDRWLTLYLKCVVWPCYPTDQFWMFILCFFPMVPAGCWFWHVLTHPCHTTKIIESQWGLHYHLDIPKFRFVVYIILHSNSCWLPFLSSAWPRFPHVGCEDN